MGIMNEDVLEPIPLNFVERAIAMVKMKEGQRGDERTDDVSANAADSDGGGCRTERTAAADSTERRQNPPKANEGDSAKFFKDASGNEYKVDGGILYAKTWKTLNAKVRIIKTANGKEVPMDGKAVQVFGWVRVEDSIKSDSDDVDVSEIEDESNG